MVFPKGVLYFTNLIICFEVYCLTLFVLPLLKAHESFTMAFSYFLDMYPKCGNIHHLLLVSEAAQKL
jgi:hypothetical protein